MANPFSGASGVLAAIAADKKKRFWLICGVCGVLFFVLMLLAAACVVLALAGV